MRTFITVFLLLKFYAQVLTLAVVYIFYNLSIKAKIEDCPTVLQDLRQSLSTLLDTHYISIPISHVAKLHEKVANAIVACGMLAADNSTNQL